MLEFEIGGFPGKTEAFLERLSRGDIYQALNRLGQEGVVALGSATPIDSGETAYSWGYEVQRTRDSASIIWTNSNVVGGTPLVIMLQYGHGTGTGGYVQGRDFINPAIRPIFDKIANEVWKAVTSA